MASWRVARRRIVHNLQSDLRRALWTSVMTSAPVKMVFLDRDTLRPEAALRGFGFPHVLETFARTSPAQAAARIAEAEIVVTNKTPLSEATISSAPNLKMIAIAATGVDIVDLAACRARGIVVSNVRDYARTTVPEHVFALLFALRRNLLPYREAVIAGRWQAADQFCFFDYPITDLAGSTMGIVGRGALGREVARVAQALGMHVQFSAHKGDRSDGARVTFEALLQSSDVITLHCPLLPETRGMISDAEFAAMRRRPILINTARGGLVDEPALARALEGGLIAGAGLDVASVEPPPPDHVLMKLARRHDVVLTPHVAWASVEAVQALVDQLVGNIEAFVAGTPRNCVA